jgi:hypothetical protein
MACRLFLPLFCKIGALTERTGIVGRAYHRIDCRANFRPITSLEGGVQRVLGPTHGTDNIVRSNNKKAPDDAGAFEFIKLE